MFRHLRVVVGVLIGAAAFMGAPAHAAVLVEPAGDCPAEAGSRVFARWLDPARYVLIPDGGFERGADGWTLSSGAVVVAGRNQPWGRPGDAAALVLRSGARASSPPVCVGLEHPTLRFFARNTGSLLGVLTVEVIVRSSLGRTVALPIGVVAGISRSWSPTLPMPVLGNLLTLLDGGTSVSFRFTAAGLGSSWEIDDVYVDPYVKG
jgi:hypothetical protein